MKKAIAIILSILLIILAIPVSTVSVFAEESVEIWDGTKASAFAGGDGTAENPYQISNGKELAYLLTFITGTYANRSMYYCLTSDIYLNDISNYNTWTASTMGLNEWTPLSSPTVQFLGHFDGQNHTVYGMYITQSTLWAGLFGFFNGAMVSNLNVVSSYISTPLATNNGAGGIVGKMTNATVVENCSADVKIVLPELPAAITVGGIAGAIMNGSTIRNCVNFGDITVTTISSNVTVGGIAGGANAQPTAVAGTISQCYNLGNISGSKVKGAGGILGFDGWNSTLGSINLSDCYNEGRVSGLDGKVPTGGIVGYSRNSFTATNCFNVGSLIGSPHYTKQILGQAYKNLSETLEVSLVGCYSNSDLGIDAYGSYVVADANTKALSFEDGELVSQNMTTLSGEVWNLSNDKMPTLKNISGIFKISVLGAEILETVKDFYDGATKVSEGQGIRFGVVIRNADRLVDVDALNSYSAGIVIEQKGSIEAKTITAKALTYDAKTNSITFTGYLVGIESADFDTVFEATGFIQKGTERWESDVYGRSIRQVAESLEKDLDENGNLVEIN